MEKAYLASMFPSLDKDIVDLALDASGGAVENALNALLVYQSKKEGGGSNQAPSGEQLNLVVVNNRSQDRASFTFQPEQKVQDVVEAVKQRDGWHSKGILYHNYFQDGEFVCQKLSADLSQPLCKLHSYPPW